MSGKAKEKPTVQSRIVPVVLFILAAALIAASIGGYALQNAGDIQKTLDTMRTNAVLHTASEGLVNSIAQQARADKLAELRKDKNFRKRGLDEVNAICDGAMEEARAAAEALYANPVVKDQAALESAIEAFEAALAEASILSAQEKGVFSDLYVQLVDNISNWTEIAGEGKQDSEILASLAAVAPGVNDNANSHLQSSFVRLARDMAAKQQAKEDGELQNQLITLMVGAVADWTEYSGLDQAALWDKLLADVPALADNVRFKDAMLTAAQGYVAAAEKGEAINPPAEADKGADTVSETQADYSYFVPTEALTKEETEKNEAYEALKAQLIAIIPDLGGLSAKLQTTLRESLEKVLWLGDTDFSTRYNAYTAHQSGAESEGAWKLNLASMAKPLLLAGIAVLLLGLVLFFWKQLTTRFGVPRTIIALFLVYL
ncbi:MAG: hypothetical protein IJS41_05700 [Clostridia bacterium]|nr:hypothetical protein [Clostridia bacterium]